MIDHWNYGFLTFKVYRIFNVTSCDFGHMTHLGFPVYLFLVIVVQAHINKLYSVMHFSMQHYIILIYL